MENCFDKEINFISRGFDGTNHTKGRKKATATFQDLDTTVKAQHRLHFLITSIFKAQPAQVSAMPGEKVPAKLDPDILYDLTVKAVQVLWVETPGFTAQDKEEFLSDSGALLPFGLWLMQEKVNPFFSELMPD